jgi:hypothetical protein
VHVAAGREAALLEVDEADAPAPALDRRVAQRRWPTARRALGAVDARQAPLGVLAR